MLIALSHPIAQPPVGPWLPGSTPWLHHPLHMPRSRRRPSMSIRLGRIHAALCCGPLLPGPRRSLHHRLDMPRSRSAFHVDSPWSHPTPRCAAGCFRATLHHRDRRGPVVGLRCRFALVIYAAPRLGPALAHAAGPPPPDMSCALVVGLPCRFALVASPRRPAPAASAHAAASITHSTCRGPVVGLPCRFALLALPRRAAPRARSGSYAMILTPRRQRDLVDRRRVRRRQVRDGTDVDDVDAAPPIGARCSTSVSSRSKSLSPDAARVLSWPGEIACTRMPLPPSCTRGSGSTIRVRPSRAHDAVRGYHLGGAMVADRRTSFRRFASSAARRAAPSARTEWHDTSIALAKPAAEQLMRPPCRSSFGAKAIECTRMSSSPHCWAIASNTASSSPSTLTSSGRSSRFERLRQRLDVRAGLVVEQMGDGELRANSRNALAHRRRSNIRWRCPRRGAFRPFSTGRGISGRHGRLLPHCRASVRQV